ncbi:TVP38/TMEM64 family inner membrane protein YdjZ [Lysinibacillus sphaericus]|uniref:TVP38/TMEM64 family membrane protein n=1 Tax=Lysinibacillus sphaericus TaxID=1421 RepID=A0A2S5D4J1_LYSSH|nr:TVP38/TMEM64 family protein [Lysinibacillus sphaericus]POZ57995.1 TVP38/TMEM64 family inner membrane protein YdjZ [Lysinibacillus sphaericus]
MNEWFTVENMEHIAAQYRTLGPIMGILLPFLEAFLPFLPLVVFVVANASAFGLWIGFLLSWLGSVAGSYAVFLLVRHFGKHPKLRFVTGSKKVQKFIKWVDMNGISPLFVLLCFPFTPSVIVNIVAGLSHIHKKYYLTVLLAGKFVMIFGMSVLGYDLKSLITSPVRLISAGVAIVLLWWIGKLMEKRLNARVERDLKRVRKMTKNE